MHVQPCEVPSHRAREAPRGLTGQALRACVILLVSLLVHEGTLTGSKVPRAKAQGDAPGRAEFVGLGFEGAEVLGQFGGPVSLDVAIEAGRPLAWRGVGPRVVAIDLSAEPPRTIGRSEVLPASVSRVVAADGWVVAAHVPEGRSPESLWLLDGRDPAWPRRVSELPMAEWVPGGWVVSGDVLAIGLVEAVQLVDLRDPTRPRFAQRLTRRAGAAVYGLTFEGGRLHVIWDDELVTIDPSDPDDARVEHVLILPSRGDAAAPFESVSDGRTLAVLDRLRSVHLIRLADPSGPRLERSLPALPTHRPPALAGGRLHALVSDADTDRLQLRSYDLAASTSQRGAERSQTDLPATYPRSRLAAGGDRLALSLEDHGLWAWRVDAHARLLPTEPWQPMLSRPLHVRPGASGRELWVADAGGALGRIDVASPNRPRLRGRLDFGGDRGGPSLRAIAHADGRMWVLRTDGQLGIFERDAADRMISPSRWVDPPDRKLLGAAGARMDAAGDLAVVTNGARIVVYSIDAEGDLRRRGSVIWPQDHGAVVDLQLHEGRAWMGGGFGLRVTDVRDPDHLRTALRMPNIEVLALTVVGRRAYVVARPAARTRGGLPVPTHLMVMDAHGSGSPELLGVLDLPGGEQARIAAEPGRAYVAVEGSGLHVIDLRIDELPDELAVLAGLDRPRWLHAADGVLWSADDERGVVALRPLARRGGALFLPWLTGDLR